VAATGGDLKVGLAGGELVFSKLGVMHVLVPMFLNTPLGALRERLGDLAPAIALVAHLLEPQLLGRRPWCIGSTLLCFWFHRRLGLRNGRGRRAAGLGFRAVGRGLLLVHVVRLALSMARAWRVCLLRGHVGISGERKRCSRRGRCGKPWAGQVRYRALGGELGLRLRLRLGLRLLCRLRQ
jgi:hypothetical protein